MGRILLMPHSVYYSSVKPLNVCWNRGDENRALTQSWVCQCKYCCAKAFLVLRWSLVSGIILAVNGTSVLISGDHLTPLRGWYTYSARRCQIISVLSRIRWTASSSLRWSLYVRCWSRATINRIYICLLLSMLSMVYLGQTTWFKNDLPFILVGPFWWLYVRRRP